MTRARLVAIGLAIAISAMLGEAGLAQEFEEITITATRTERKAQDVGISVSAFSGDQLRSVGITDSTDVTLITPGLQLPQSNSGFTSSFAIRGVTQSDFGASQEAPVALYLDDVYQSSQNGALFQLFDIERVEVLRGPQGTLFGRNATGGLVHFLTKKPSDELGGYGEISYGRFDRFKAEGAVNVPLSDTLFVRASVIGDFHEDIVRNRNDRDVWDREEYAGRLQFLFVPSSDLEFRLSLRGGRRDNTGAPYAHAAATPSGVGGTGVFQPFGTPDFLGFSEPDRDPFTVGIDDVSKMEAETWGVTGTLSWDIGGITLTSITDYSGLEFEAAEDSDIQPGEFFHFDGVTEHEQLAQEIRLNGELDRARWTVGAYYLFIDGEFDQRGLITDLGFGVDEQVALYDVETNSYSLFAQGEYDITDLLTLTLGARWILDDKEQDYENFFTIDGFAGKIPFGASGSPNLVEFSDSESESIYSLRVQLDYDVTEDILLYASYNRGVKGFGYNAPLDPSGSALFVDPLTFDPAVGVENAFKFDDETLHAYEVGFKSTIGGSTRLNVAAFYYDYDDYQALNLEGITQIITNNDARMYGFDAELFTAPIEGMDIVLGAAYLDTEVDDVNVGGVILDREVAYAPEWSFTGLIRQEWIVGGGTLAAQANARYTDEHYFGLSNAAVLEESGYIVANARLSYTLPNQAITVAAFVNNLADEEYRTIAFDLAGFFGSVESQFGRPREIGVSIGMEF